MSKYKSLIIIMFFIIAFSISRIHSVFNDMSLIGKAICLDAGHGGVDVGAISKRIIEKEMNLVLVKKLETKLIAKGALVVLTRDGDYELTKSTYNRKRNDLYNRAVLINNSGCDLFLSIHLNSMTNANWRGIQVFYNSRLKENKIVAEVTYTTLKENMPNIKKNKEVNNYYMYRLIKIPGILIEAGFISNPNDNYLLRQEYYREKLTDTILKSIENYVSLSN